MKKDNRSFFDIIIDGCIELFGGCGVNADRSPTMNPAHKPGKNPKLGSANIGNINDSDEDNSFKESPR